jgi:hypothetical protein
MRKFHSCAVATLFIPDWRVGSIINPSFQYIHTCWQNKESLESDTISDPSSLALINEIYLKSYENNIPFETRPELKVNIYI